MTDTTKEREALRNLLWAAEERDKGNRIRQFDEFIDAARASLLAEAEPVPTDEWKVRGYLAATLKCWHRLTGEEAAQLVAMTLRLSGLYPTPQPATPTEQHAYDMGAKGATATEAERLLFEAWMRGHCWALCATWDGKCYRSDAEQGGDIDPRAMNTRRLWAAWRDRAALAAPAQAPAPGWVSVEERLPEPNVEVLCAGQGWGDPFVTACYYDDERREWYPINTHWTDSTGQAQYPTHWMPLPAAPSSGTGG